jgi:hypothetical protein
VRFEDGGEVEPERGRTRGAYTGDVGKGDGGGKRKSDGREEEGEEGKGKGKGEGEGEKGKEGKARQVEGRIRARSLDCRGRGCSLVSLCWVSQVWQRLSPILPFRLRSLILFFCNRCSSPACTQSAQLHLRSSRLASSSGSHMSDLSDVSSPNALYRIHPTTLISILAFFSVTSSHRYARSSFMRPVVSVPAFLFCSSM